MRRNKGLSIRERRMAFRGTASSAGASALEPLIVYYHFHASSLPRSSRHATGAQCAFRCADRRDCHLKLYHRLCKFFDKSSLEAHHLAFGFCKCATGRSSLQDGLLALRYLEVPSGCVLTHARPNEGWLACPYVKVRSTTTMLE